MNASATQPFLTCPAPDSARSEGLKLSVYTINISGGERWDGEAPYAYLVWASSFPAAMRLAWLHHMWVEITQEGAISATDEDEWGSADDDVVVVDSPDHPCFEGAPFNGTCTSLRHVQLWIGAPQFPDDGTCSCAYWWMYLSWTETDAAENAEALEALLTELGFEIPAAIPVDRE